MTHQHANPLVLVVHPEERVRSLVQSALCESQFSVKTADTFRGAVEAFYDTPPRCVLSAHDMRNDKGRSLVQELKSDNVYGHLPVILMVSREQFEQRIDWFSIPADEYVVEPFMGAEIVSRVNLSLARAQRDVNANPLTCLPGNLTIRREAEERLAARQAFSFAYLDLDGFKAYNDRYGFLRGDEVLRMTSRVLVNTLRSLDDQQTYVGHIGGDDFVFIVPSSIVHEACEAVVRDFDMVIRDFYDEEDRQNGCIHSNDRRGNPQVFPIMTCSIGVVDTSVTSITYVAELLERVSEVKSHAKHLPGTHYVIDRRK